MQDTSAQDDARPGMDAVAGGPQAKGVGIRFLALLIDTVIFSVLLVVLAAVQGPLDGGCHSNSFLGLNLTLNGKETFYGLCGGPALVFFGIFLLYFVLLEWFLGATLGKLALGIRVVNVDGGETGFKGALVRNLLRLVDAFPYCIPYLLGAILVWSSRSRQRLGDIAARTIVVSRRRRR